jgi:tetratricopeptide (TPR) repeat protein
MTHFNRVSSRIPTDEHHSTRRLRAAFALVVLAGSALGGCAGSTPSPQVQQQRVMQEESTAEELVKRGQASAAIGDMTRAEQYLVSAMKAGADERAVVPRLLVVCVADERYPVALEYAERYLQRFPHDLDVGFAAASIHAALGDTRRARTMLEAVVRGQPRRSEAHFALASVLRQADASDLADRHDLEYLRLNPEGPLAERARARLGRVVP